MPRLLAVVLAGMLLVLVAPSARAQSQAQSRAQSEAQSQAQSQARSRDGRALEVQRRLLEASAAHARATHRLEVLQQHHAARTALAEQATGDADSAAASVDGSVGLVGALGALVTDGEDLDDAHEALEGAQHLRDLAGISAAGLTRAQQDLATASVTLRQARTDAQRLERSTTAQASARLALEWGSLSPAYQASTPERDQLNRRAVARWHDAVRAMGAAAVTPPSPDTLARGRLTDGLRPARDETGRVIPGAALARGRDGEPLTVVPDVTVRAVSTALSRLGVVTGTADCAEFVQEIWAAAQVDVPGDSRSLWESLPAADERQVVAGDVVFFEHGDVLGLGLSIGPRLVVALDPTAGEVVVERVAPTDVLAVRRVTLASDRGGRVAATPDEVLRGCTPPPTAAVPGSGGWALPVAAGSFSLSAGFGQAGSLWSSGSHTGLDFAAPLGTPVAASAAGHVTVTPVGWAGQLVRIDHGEGLETWYAHMSRVDVSTGDVVGPGTVLGAVGSEGNSTGPHLHFEVRRGGVPDDPMTFLAANGVDPGA